MKSRFPLVVAVAVVQAVFCQSSLANAELLQTLPENAMPGLKELLNQAMVDSEEVANRTLAEREAQGGLKVGRSRLKPRLRADIVYRLEDSVNRSDSDVEDRQIASVSLEQPLFHWGVLNSDKKIYEIRHRLSQVTTRQSLRNLARSVRLELLKLCVQKQSLAQYEAAIDLQKDDLERFRVIVANGDGIERNLQEREIGVKRSTLTRQRLRFDFDHAVERLARSIGVSSECVLQGLPEAIPEVEVLSDEVLASLDQLEPEALQNNDGLVSSQLNVEIARRRLQMVEKRLYPKVNLTTGLTQNERDVNGRLTDDELVYAGVNVRWNIFDGFETAGLKESALAGLERAERSAQLSRLEAEDSFSRLVESVRRVASTLRLDELLLQNSAEDLELTEQEFALDKVSELDLKHARQRFGDLELAAQRQRINYMDAVTALVSALGLDPYVDFGLEFELTESGK